MDKYKKAHSDTCRINLRSLGPAIMIYRLKHANVFPTSLEDLITSGAIDRGSLPKCPAKDAKPYVLITPSDKNPPGTTIIVRDADAVHGDHVNVLRIDGSVGQVSLEQAGFQAPLPPGT